MAEPQIKVIDPPEALALAIAVRENCICVTENKGVLGLVKLHRNLFNVQIGVAMKSSKKHTLEV